MQTEKNILKTLAYFDMFHYPVSAGEIHRFLGCPSSAALVFAGLQQLVVNGCVFRFGECYTLHNDASLIERRKKGNEQADKLLHTAYRIAGFLYAFPFVKGVGISGSLSKHYADADADIDFFIITRSNRLWIARTLMHCLKKLSFLAGRQDWYCMNYYVDEEALMIGEQNIFTATEVVTLLPVYGEEAMARFFSINQWTKDYLPNDEGSNACMGKKKGRQQIKVMMERIFDNAFGEWLDNYLMRLTTRRWQKKEAAQQMNSKGEPIGLKTGKHFSRPNPEHFQKKILRQYADKVQAMEHLPCMHTGAAIISSEGK